MGRRKTLRWLPLAAYPAVAALERGWAGPPQGVTWLIQNFSGRNANRPCHFALLHRSDPTEQEDVIFARVWSGSLDERPGAKTFSPPLEIKWPEQLGWYFCYATIGDLITYLVQGWEVFGNG